MKGMDYDVIIVGGGAGGLACAVTLSGSVKKLRTAVIEAGNRLGKKLAATGNGQGNVSNLDMRVGHYHGSGVRLAEKIACADPYDGTRLFGCLFEADEKGRIYPSGRQASALTDDLLNSLKRADTAVFSGSTADKIEKIEGGFALEGDFGRKTARFVVLATGGVAQPVLKGVSPYALAEMLGHTVTPLYPSLVQIKTETKFIKTLKGLRANCKITAYSGGQALKSERGDVIFTEYGVSGNAVFALSECITDRKNVTLSIEFLPDVPAERIAENLAVRRESGCDVKELLSGTLHNQIGRAVIARAGGSDDEIIKTLKNFTLPVTGTLGFAYAQATRGGIRADEVTDELESKFADRFFIAGEALDVDGDCGGYNLQWAFTSGARVAECILKRI